MFHSMIWLVFLFFQHKVLSQMSSDSQLSISETVSDLFYDAEEYLLSDEESSTDGEVKSMFCIS